METENKEIESKGIQPTKDSQVTTDEVSPTEVSEIKIIPIRNKYGLVAIASCVIDKKFFLGSIGVYFEEGKYRLTYPTKKHKMSSMTIFHPINVPAGNQIFDQIIKEYENLLSVDI